MASVGRDGSKRARLSQLPLDWPFPDTITCFNSSLSLCCSVLGRISPRSAGGPGRHQAQTRPAPVRLTRCLDARAAQHQLLPACMPSQAHRALAPSPSCPSPVRTHAPSDSQNALWARMPTGFWGERWRFVWPGRGSGTVCVVCRGWQKCPCA